MNHSTARVLIADDNQEELDLMSSLIENQFNCEILQAKNGMGALKTIIKESPALDLLILDMTMYDLQGRDVLTIIKSNQELRDLAVIVYGTSAPKTDVPEICHYANVDFVEKPTAATALISKVVQLLSSKAI